MSAAVAAATDRGYRALGGAGGAGVASACRLAWVEGPDAAGFLHGLLTSDVLALEVGDVQPALLLNAKGHVRAAVRVLRDASDAFTLLLDPAPGPDPVAALEALHFSEDLEILGPEPSDLAVIAEADAARADAAGDLVVPGRVPGTAEVVVPDARAALAALGLEEAPAEALEALRIEAGVPLVGVDTGETTLVQEALLDRDAVSYTKGCYLGQETVARLHYRGHANRTLRGLVLPGMVAAGAEVRAGGRAAGRLTSAAVSPARGPVGLAILRREVSPGDEVEVAGAAGPARVVALPFPA